MDYSNNKLVVIKPIDSAATSMVAYDIFPWRGRADGTVPFVIGGAGFGTLSGTTVTIGGTQATLTSVSATRIKGSIPANAAPSTQLLDVVCSRVVSKPPFHKHSAIINKPKGCPLGICQAGMDNLQGNAQGLKNRPNLVR